MGKYVLFFYAAGDRTLSLRHVRQMPYHFAIYPSTSPCVRKDTQALHIPQTQCIYMSMPVFNS